MRRNKWKLWEGDLSQTPTKELFALRIGRGSDTLILKPKAYKAWVEDVSPQCEIEQIPEGGIGLFGPFPKQMPKIAMNYNITFNLSTRAFYI